MKIEKTFHTFDPRGYLNHYYSSVDYENDELLHFFIDAYKYTKKNSLLLEFSGGPTIYSLITAAPKVKEIHFSDHLKSNLDEVKLWKYGNHGAFDWSPFIKRALELEGKKDITKNKIDHRAHILREKITSFLYCNAFNNIPLRKKHIPLYDIVNVNFVPESITETREVWEKALSNITSLLKPGGIFITTALKNAKYYELLDKKFPAVNINENDLCKTIQSLGFDKSSIKTHTIKAPIYRGYEGFIFLKAKKH